MVSRPHVNSSRFVSMLPVRDNIISCRASDDRQPSDAQVVLIVRQEFLRNQFQVRWRRARPVKCAYVECDDANCDPRLKPSRRRVAPRVRPARRALRRNLFCRDHVDAYLLPSGLSVAHRASGEPALFRLGRRRRAIGLSRVPPLSPRSRARPVADRRSSATRACGVKADCGRRAQRVEHHRVGAATRRESTPPASCGRARVRCSPARAGGSLPPQICAELVGRNRYAGHPGRVRERLPECAPFQRSVQGMLSGRAHDAAASA